MTILTVGNHIAILNKLAENLPGIFPDAEIIKEGDSLMACKYSFNHNVDILIAEVNMKRLNGVQLIQFVRKECPGVKTYLLGTKSEFDESPIIIFDDVSGIIINPFTPESLRNHLFDNKKPV